MDTHHRSHHTNVLGAGVFVVLGVLLLGRNFDVLDTSRLHGIAPLWPILLILLGLQLILGRHRIGRGIMVFLVALFAATVIAVAYKKTPLPNWVTLQLNGNSAIQTRQFAVGSESFSADTSREVDITTPVGKLFLHDMADDRFIDSSFDFYGENRQPTVSQDESNNRIKITISNQDQGWLFFQQPPESHISVGRPSLVTDFQLEQGTADADINLQALMIRQFNLTTGSGNATITFSLASVPSEASTLKTGTGNIQLTIPKNVGLSLKYELGTGQLSVGSTTLHGQGTFSTEGFDVASSKLTLTLTGGTGNIMIIRQ